MVAAIRAFFGFNDSSDIIPRYTDPKTNPFADALEVAHEILDPLGGGNPHTDTKNGSIHIRKSHSFPSHSSKHRCLCHNIKPD